MARLIPATERIVRARQLIQQARELSVPGEGGKNNLAYIAQVKDLLRQARDLVKFISMQPTSTAEMKQDIKRIFEEIDQADREILR